MTNHDAVALEALAEAKVKGGNMEALDVQNTARQGDVIFQRVDNVKIRGAYKSTPECGAIIAAGAHGEHRLISGNCRISHGNDGVMVDIKDEAYVVHTDAPQGRHRALRLRPGTYKIHRQCELTVDQVITQVRD